MNIRILVTGGTFDKEYDMIEGKLYFNETHVPEMLKLGRSDLDIDVRTLMMIDSLEMTDADRELIAHQAASSDERPLEGQDSRREAALGVSPYLTPLIIMAPIPLTIVGVMPGHALLGAQFTATSMIGMIALAGIIVRNSILLVDFIRLQQSQGVPLKTAVTRSAATRAQPIVLTGLAAMLGAFFILDDPIFNGLAVALIFGIFVSTMLTLVVIPLLYFVAHQRREVAALAVSPSDQGAPA